MIASGDQSVPSSLGYLKPYRRQLVWGFVMLLLTNGFYLGVPVDRVASRSRVSFRASRREADRELENISLVVSP